MVALITMSFAPMAAAEIFRCDGPEGPIFSDEKCGSDSAIVNIEESAGLTGVTDQTKSDLAEKKLEREQDRNQSGDRAVNSYGSNSSTTEANGRWVRGQGQLKNRIDSGVATPLPNKPAPATPRRRRN
jgi:hypothetical protein